MESITPTPNPVSSRFQIKFENIIKYQYFDLIKDNIIYKIFIGMDKKYILIKSRKYIIEFHEEEFSSFINQKIDKIEKAYDFLVSSFEEDNIYIKKIIKNKSIILIIINNEKEISIELKYRFNNEDFIFNEMGGLKTIKDLKNEIEELKIENISLKNEIKNRNIIFNNENNTLKNNINELKEEIKKLKKELETFKKITENNNNNNNAPKNLELLFDLYIHTINQI